MLAIAELLAGLGLLFIGLKLLSGHLQQAMGRRVRGLLKAATGSRLAGLACGTLTGAIVQSSNAVTLITANLVRGGVLTTREAIPVVAGANVGTSLLVFIASVNLKVAVLYLVAMVGIAYQLRLDRKSGLRDWIGVLLGLALLFLGLSFIKLAPQEVPRETMAALLMGVTPLVGMLIGFAAATITQSASTATILCVAAIGTGAIDLHDAFFIVLGANFGSGVATLISAGTLKGTGKQLCFAHIFVKFIGCLVVYLAWLCADLSGLDPAGWLVATGAKGSSFVISIIFLVLQAAGAAAVTLFCGASEALAQRLSPPTHEDHVSKPHFITEEAMADPASALVLAAQETNRLVGKLPHLLPDLDQRAAGNAQFRAAHFQGGRTIGLATEAFLVDLIDHKLTREDLDLALLVQDRQRLVLSLQDTLKEFGDMADCYQAPPPLLFNLTESLRTLVLELAEARDGPAAEIEVVVELTADRSAILDRIRRSLAAGGLGTGEEARKLLVAVSLFERALWLLHRLAITLREPAA